jgi:outer membrane receptor for ferrienterochelin and colicins
MRFHFVLVLCVVISLHATYGQNTLRAYILDSETKAPLSGATASVKGTAKGAIADENGLVILTGMPVGHVRIEFRYIGYQPQTKAFDLPLAFAAPVEILLRPEEGELEEIIITSTRSSRTILDLPTRVESIAGEELEEKSNMKTGDIRMLLSESTGIHTQQTSATSANASIRIQGLDGRYTQILKDGFPLYSGAASGLGLLQIPPLDLQQVEVIKGSASTLYGGGAIAGLVNLVSKTPGEERELGFHLNGISSNAFDLNGFFSKKYEKTGTTIFASHNRSREYDPAGTGFSAIPRFSRYVLNPNLFLYFSDNTRMNVGINTVIENRLGGDIQYIRGEPGTAGRYFEENKTQRYSARMSFDHSFSETSSLNIRNSISHFNRRITIPGYKFDGTQQATFSEISYTGVRVGSEWVAGVNLWTDNFSEKPIDAFQLRDYRQITIGAFIQNALEISPLLSLESGIRTDYIVDYGLVFLPRISALFRIAENFSSRIGGGFGYKPPTIFTEESERIQYRDVLPVDSEINQLERSYGANIDFNYRATIAGKFIFSLNQLFFYTYLDSPLLLEIQETGFYRFINSPGYMDSRGTETNIKLGLGDFKMFLGYTYTDARLRHDGITSDNPLTPGHRINSVLMYEVEEKWKAGLEAYYFGKQVLSDGRTGKQYTIFGFMVERLWEKFSIYINFENFLDVRQTRFDTIYTGTPENPVFRDIYAPLDGFLVNGGIKIRL